LASTVILVLLLDHVTFLFVAFAGNTVAVSRLDAPIPKDKVVGATVTPVTAMGRVFTPFGVTSPDFWRRILFVFA
jgi:hypothetical protein